MEKQMRFICSFNKTQYKFNSSKATNIVKKKKKLKSEYVIDYNKNEIEVIIETSW